MINSHYLKLRKDYKTNKISIVIGLFLILNSAIYGQNTDSLKIQKLYKQIENSYENKQFEHCRDWAEDILQIDSSNCNAYMWLGIIYASIPMEYLKEITEEVPERNTIYCLAVDMFQKAREKDTSCLSEANKYIDIYSKYFPSIEGLWISPHADFEYKFGGWINRTTKVRFSRL